MLAIGHSHKKTATTTKTSFFLKLVSVPRPSRSWSHSANRHVRREGEQRPRGGMGKYIGKRQESFMEAKREASFASRPAKPEPGKHNRKAHRLRRTGPGGGERLPCPVQSQKTISTKKRARMQEIAEHLASVGALPECEPMSKQVGTLSGSSKAAAKKRRRKESAAAAPKAAAATSAAQAAIAAVPAINFW